MLAVARNQSTNEYPILYSTSHYLNVQTACEAKEAHEELCRLEEESAAGAPQMLVKSKYFQIVTRLRDKNESPTFRSIIKKIIESAIDFPAKIRMTQSFLFSSTTSGLVRPKPKATGLNAGRPETPETKSREA
jgi:hypothetical protein